RSTIALRRVGHTAAALDEVSTNRGKVTLDRIRALLDEIATGARLRYEESLAEHRAHFQRARRLIALTTVASTALMALAMFALNRQVLDRLAAERVVRDQRRHLDVTLRSIGDGVISVDLAGRVAFLNPVAERLTGWSSAEAEMRPLGEVFRIVSEETRAPVEDPVTRVLREGVVVGLGNSTVLVRKNGAETPIEDSAAFIVDDDGETEGAVL